MIHITAIIPDANNPISFFRGAGPMQLLERQFPDIQVHIIDLRSVDYVGWSDIIHTDILFMQSPNSQMHKEIFDTAKKMMVPVWIDFDDNLLQPPAHHRLFDELNKNKNRIIDMLFQADAITVSTPALKKMYEIDNSPVDVVYNAIPRWAFPGNKSQAESYTIMWRGGDGHEEDVREIMPYLLPWLEEHPTYQIMALGNMPWILKENIPAERLLHVSGKPVPEYFAWLKSVWADVCIVPLRDTPFNRAKSNNGWIEATMAGAPCVAPSYIPEFNNKSISTYDSLEGFSEALDYAIKHSRLLFTDSINKITRDHKYSLKWQNATRYAVLCKLMGRRAGVKMKNMELQDDLI